MTRVLVVEDSPTQAQQIAMMLEDAGYEVGLAGNGVQALDAMARQRPDAVLTDLDMPEMNGLQLVENVRLAYPSVPVILMTAYGSEDVAAAALQKGAASYVPKRYLDEDIVPTIENVLTLAGARQDQRRVVDCFAEAEAKFVLPSDPGLVPALVGRVEEQLSWVGLWDETGVIQLCVALREALMNAICHGNLELGSGPHEVYDPVLGAAPESGESDESVFYSNVIANQDLLEERRRQPEYQDRRVHFGMRLSRERVEFTIRDEGPGFDPSRLPDPADPSNLEKVRGRGLLLIRSFMDEVRHNDKGNEITMVKQPQRR